MTKYFVFLLNLLFISGWHQLQALLLHPLIFNNQFFEDLDWSSYNNSPKDGENSQELDKYPPDISIETIAKAESEAKKYLANYDRMKKLYSFLPENRFNPSRDNVLSHFPNKRQDEEARQDWHIEPLDFSNTRASMKKLPVDDNKRIKRISGNPDEPLRFVDYTNSQMPFNEGRMHRKSLRGKSEDVAEKKNSARSVPRRHFVALPASNFFDIPGDDPSLEYSRVRRFLDSKRAKKQIRMSPTLEAKEAEMSGILDPNLNSDAVLEPHVRKRRGKRKLI